MLNPTPLACCKAELAKISIVPPSDAALTALIETDDYLTDKLNQYYTNEGEDSLDTAEREELYDLIAQHFTGRGWPTNMDSHEISHKFVIDFVASAIAAEWMTKG